MIVDTFSSPPELFSGFWDYMSRPTHDRLVALRQTSWIPREGKKRRREDLARLLFHFSPILVPLFHVLGDAEQGYRAQLCPGIFAIVLFTNDQNRLSFGLLRVSIQGSPMTSHLPFFQILLASFDPAGISLLHHARFRASERCHGLHGNAVL